MQPCLCPLLSLLLIAGCGGNLQVRPAPDVSQSAAAPASDGMSDADVAIETTRLRAALLLEVPQASVEIAGDDGAWVSRTKAAVDAGALVISRAQLLVVVDRDPAVQELRIVLARPDGPWQVIGGSKVSTGQSGRRGYFITPVGIFLHTDDILDYRALGTFNENHIRGLGQGNARLGLRLASRRKRLEGRVRSGRHPVADARHGPGLSGAAAGTPCVARLRSGSVGDEPLPGYAWRARRGL